MIRVTLDLISAVAADRSRRIGHADIVNIGGTEHIGSYLVRLYLGRPGVVWRECRLDGFPRKRLNAWDLLCRGLATILGNQNGYLPKSSASEANMDRAVERVMAELSRTYDARLEEGAAILRLATRPAGMDPAVRLLAERWLAAHDAQERPMTDRRAP